MRRLALRIGGAIGAALLSVASAQAADWINRVKPVTPPTSQWLRALGSDGAFVPAQPAFSDISGRAAANQLPAFAGGDCTSTAGSVALACTKTNGSPFAPVATSGSASDLTTGTLPLSVIPPSLLIGSAGTPGSIFATSSAGVDTGLAYASKVAGSGGTNGTYNVTVASSGGGTNAVVQIVISGGSISGTPSVTTAGSNFTGTKTIANADIVAAGATGLTGASVTLTANGGVSFGAYYWVVSATQGAALDLYKNVSGVATAQGTSLATGAALNPLYAISSSVNQFDYTKVTEGYEVYPSGAAIQTNATSSVSGPIYVYGQVNITISGLSGLSTIPVYMVFYGDDGSTVISRPSIPSGSTSGTITVPAGAYWMQLTTRSREVSTPTYTNIQVEYGGVATAKVSYAAPQILKVFGYDIYHQTPVGYTGQKNLFDKTAVTAGYEVYGDGSISAEGSSAVSDYIWVGGQSSITVSGLQPPNGFANVYGVFLGADKTTIVQAAIIWPPGTPYTIPIPTGAMWFRFSPKQRNADPASYNAVQVEYGQSATTYAAFEKRILSVNGTLVDKNYIAPGSNASVGGFGKKFLIFGDSKTETATITGTTSGGAYTEGTRENWPKFTMAYLGASAWKNYATSGASFAYGVSLTTFQYLRNQITRAHNDNVQADVVIISAGTNDQGNAKTLGSVSTAMGKSAGSLDNTIVLEAMRLDLIDVRTYWPNSLCLYATPQQRADFTVAQQQIYLAPMVQMAQIYGCDVIDQNGQLGIVTEFESVSGLPAGRYLRDGLHETVTSDSLPAGVNVAGTVLAGRFMATKIANSLTFR